MASRKDVIPSLGSMVSRCVVTVVGERSGGLSEEERGQAPAIVPGQMRRRKRDSLRMVE